VNHYRAIVEALGAPKVADLCSILEAAVFQSADRHLQIYAGEVLAILRSPVLRDLGRENRPVRLPTDRAPYSSLLAHCLRRLHF
jgi:hypothetical protein